MPTALQLALLAALFSGPLSGEERWWHLEAGTGWEDWQVSDHEQSEASGIQDAAVSSQAWRTHCRVGAEGAPSPNLILSGGYGYLQRWYVEQLTVGGLLAPDPTDHPWRRDQLVRQHNLWGEAAWAGSSFEPGVTTALTWTRMGAQSGDGQGGSSGYNLLSSRRTSVKLWLGVSLPHDFNVRPYLLASRTLVATEADRSHQSFTRMTYPQTYSWGVAATGALPRWNGSTRLHLWRYHYLYNDPFSDHADTGATFGVAFPIQTVWTVGASVGQRHRRYDLDRSRFTESVVATRVSWQRWTSLKLDFRFLLDRDRLFPSRSARGEQQFLVGLSWGADPQDLDFFARAPAVSSAEREPDDWNLYL